MPNIPKGEVWNDPVRTNVLLVQERINSLRIQFSSLTLYQVDVSPPKLHGAQPFLAIVLQPPQIPAGALPQLAPTAELSSLSQALRTGKSSTLLVENHDTF